MRPAVRRERPLLRGYLHAGAAVVAAIGSLALVWRAQPDMSRQIAVAVYGVSLVASYALSAGYHLHLGSRRLLLRRLDHAGIFALIAGTYTPLVVHNAAMPWRVAALAGIWLMAATGMTLAAFQPAGSRVLRVALSLAMGWAALFLVGQLWPRMPWGVGLMIAAGGAYSIGALVYAKRWPDPWPRVFGYHELFHAFTIVAGVLFWLVVFVYVAGPA